MEVNKLLKLDKHGPCFMLTFQGQSVINTYHCQVYIVCSAGEKLHFRETNMLHVPVDQGLQLTLNPKPPHTKGRVVQLLAHALSCKNEVAAPSKRRLQEIAYRIIAARQLRTLSGFADHRPGRRSKGGQQHGAC